MIERSAFRSLVRQYAIWILIALGLTVVVPLPVPATIADMRIESSDETEWAEFHADAYAEWSEIFTIMYHATEFKRAKNGASMIRRPGDKSFRFVAKG